jgi:phosphate starvation-inducible protein PhoH
MAKDRFKEQRDYEELVSINSTVQIQKIKEDISKLLPSDIKIIAKNESQKKLINSIKNNEITICAGPAGCGKAQPLDALILTENGFKNMGDINIGDNIYSMSGNLTKVINIFPQGLKDIYKITFSDNSEVECCNEHLWLVKSSKDRNNNNDYNIKQLSDLKDNFIIRDNRKNYSIPITKPINFNEIALKIHPYLMGILIGDGCFTSPNVRITTTDIEIINNINKLLDNKYKLSRIKSDLISYNIIFQDKKYSKFRLNDAVIPFIKLISEYNLLNKKSKDKFIPFEFKFNSIQNRIELLQGLMDSDGTIDKNGNTFSFTTTSKILIEDFRFLIESLGGVVNKLRIKKNKYKKNDKYIDCNNSYTYSFRLPSNVIPFKLERKKKKIKEKTKYFPIRYIKNIEYVGKKEAQCLMVDDNTHTYLTNNFIVTHNTYVAIAYALSLLRKPTNRFKKIYLVKSVTTLKGEEIGYLKGDWKEKVEPFMWSFYINMEKLLLDSVVKILVEKDIIKPFPLAYMRGASLDDCIIIADEIQNVSLDNSRTLMTRIGSNCKLILLGDINQIDMKNKNESSLEYLLKIFSDTDNIGSIEMSDEDTNVRNPIITIIEDKFREFNSKYGEMLKNYTSGSTKNNKQLLLENPLGLLKEE